MTLVLALQNHIKLVKGDLFHHLLGVGSVLRFVAALNQSMPASSGDGWVQQT
jgi:hypothetical protein